MKQSDFKDKILTHIIKTIPKPEIISTKNVFHDLMSCIIEQQIHYRSTKKIFQKMIDKAGLSSLTTDNFEEFESKAFENIKLSTNKFETIIRTVDFFKTNKINWNELQDDEVIEHLSSIKGIGKWTIEMILLYTLQRPNIFPIDDFHLKEIMVKLYELNPNIKLKQQMLEVAGHWNDKKSEAVLYLLAYKSFLKQKP